MVLESFLWLLLCSMLVPAKIIFQPIFVGFKMWKEQRTLDSTHSWLWPDNLLFSSFGVFFILWLNKSEKYCHILEPTLWKNCGYVPLSKNRAWATSGTFSLSIIYITLSIMTYMEDSRTVIIHYLHWENRNMASVTTACLWQKPYCLCFTPKASGASFMANWTARLKGTAHSIGLKGSCRAQWTSTVEGEPFLGKAAGGFWQGREAGL